MGLLTRQNPFLPMAIASSGLLAWAGVFLPGLQGLLETDPLRISDAVLALSTVVIGWAVARITHGFRGARVPAPSPSSIRILAKEGAQTK